MKHQMQRLRELAATYGPLCVGLDTSADYLPASALRTLSPAEAVIRFNERLIERVVCDRSACCFKVQAAYYEAMGVEGMKAFSHTLACVRQSGLVCISDVKRGDIAATAAAYAKAHFAGDFEADIITVNPYMGQDTLEPFAQVCKEKGKGLFVLLCTSNPGSSDIQQQLLADGHRVLDVVGETIEDLNQMLHAVFPSETCGAVGAVVGCTHQAQAQQLRDAHSSALFLIPGYGTQGGSADVCRTLLGGVGGVVNSSRGILCAWKKDAACCQKIISGQEVTLCDAIDAASRAALEAKHSLIAPFNIQS